MAIKKKYFKNDEQKQCNICRAGKKYYNNLVKKIKVEHIDSS